MHKEEFEIEFELKIINYRVSIVRVCIPSCIERDTYVLQKRDEAKQWRDTVVSTLPRNFNFSLGNYSRRFRAARYKDSAKYWYNFVQ